MVKFGVRGGAELRKRVAAIKKQKTSRYPCPRCGKKAVKRSGNSLWACNSCGAQIAGGAYSLTTAIGETARRLAEGISKSGSKK